MNRGRFYALRHHIRCGLQSWKGYDTVSKDGVVGLVRKTILDSRYDTDFEKVRPLHELIKTRSIAGKDNRIALTRIQWQNIMRSNVRHDNRVFTEQLTSY